MTYGIEKDTDLVEVARRMLKDAGFENCDQFFGRRVSEGVLELADLFQKQNHSMLISRLVVALFSRIARGSPPTPEFLREVRTEIEKAAQDEPYDDAFEKGRWIQKRYPILHWAGDLHKHINSTVFPVGAVSGVRDRISSVQKFAGAPLIRNEPMDPPFGIIDDELVPQPKVVKLSEIKNLIRKDIIIPGPISGIIPLKPVLSVITTCDEEEMFDNKIENIEKEENKMCTNSSKIVEVIRGLCKNLESFTSLDISNKVKADGFVARHREIAEFVRTAFADGEMNIYGYVRDLINVTISGGLTAQTYLYHHTTVPADDYKNRTQVAIRPSQPMPVPVSPSYGDNYNDDDDILPVLPTPIIPDSTVQVVPRTTRMLNTSSMIRAQKGDGRLEVPHIWMTRLNWQIGNTVFAVRDGNSLILKISVQPGERVVRQFMIDRWNRIRITTKALMEAGLHLGTGGQHIMSLRTGDIKID